MCTIGVDNHQGAAAYIRDWDWSRTALGSRENWSATLLSSTSLLLESAFPGCLFWGADALAFYNDAYLSAYDLPLESIGLPFRTALPDLWRSHGFTITSALAGEACFHKDVPLFLNRNGRSEHTWWTYSVSPVREQNGTVVGALAIGHETTERVLSEQRLRFLLELSTVLRTLSDSCEIATRASGELGQHLGAGRVGYIGVGGDGQVGTVVGRWTDISMPGGASSYRLNAFGEEVVRDLQAGRIVRIDDAQSDLRASGSPEIAAAYAALAIRANIAVPFMSDGHLAAIMYVQQATPRRWSESEIALIQDVAERTWAAVARAEAEAALRDSEARFRQFGEFSPHVFWIYDASEQRVEYVSPAYEHVWGEPCDAMVNSSAEHWVRTVHPDEREATLTFWKQALEQRIPLTHEYRIVRPNGTVRLIRDICFPMSCQGSDLQRVGGIAQDITKESGSRVYVVCADATSRSLTSHLLQTSGFLPEEFATVEAFLKVAPVLSPGCVLINLQSLGTGSLSIPKQVKFHGHELVIVAIDGADAKRAVQAMKAGVVDVVHLPLSTNQLSIAVGSALTGLHTDLSSDKSVDETRGRIACMTARERDVLGEMVQGGSSKVIGQRLGLSPRTVESYRRRVMQKLGAQNLSEAVRLATVAGLQVSTKLLP